MVYVLAVFAVCVQLALVAAAVYLIDLTVALSELWLELARKHLEITLS
jgi:hypothetical protein